VSDRLAVNAPLRVTPTPPVGANCRCVRHVLGGCSLSVPRHSAFVWYLLVLLLLLVAGCGPREAPKAPDIPLPVESTSFGPGDEFQLQVVGEPNWPTEYRVASDGTVDIPLLAPLKVEGLEPQQVARLVKDRLAEAKIRPDASVVVSVKQYQSKRVTVLGQVASPGIFPLTPGMTLLEVVSRAGGFTAIARSSNVRLTRQVKGEARTWELDVTAIADGRMADIPLQASDSVFVEERVF
jgi:protein involved in polysaccharide export with SLBB domain